MTAPELPGGILAPVATTFKPSGELDLDRFGQNLEVYALSALDGVVLLGSNGEFATLDMAERMLIIERGTSAIAGRRTVMAGTGVESTRATIEMTRAAAAFGVDYALVVTPHYYKTRYDKQAYLSHYLAVAEASPIPVLIYVMAAYTGVDLSPGVVIELSKHPNIVGIKDSGGNAAKVGEILAGADEQFTVLAGSANFLYAALCLGATGGILALGNIAPDQCASIMRDWRNGDHTSARATQLKMIAPNAAVTSRFGIAGLKGAMDFVGLCGGDPRPPLLPLTPAERQELEQTLRDAGIGRIV